MQLATASKGNINHLQKIQNRALRFIYNIKWDDFVTNDALHRRAKVPTIKERLSKLQDKCQSRLIEYHFEDKITPSYRFSDYIIPDPPIFDNKRDIRNCFLNHGYSLPT